MILITSLCLVLSLIGGVFMFQQNEYKLIFERQDVVRYNTSLVSALAVHNFKYNRTTAVVNATVGFKQDFGRDIKVEVQAYRFASNEYRDFPIRFMFDYCDYANKNEFGIGDLYKCGNLTRCPIKKGLYHICHWALNGTKFPPHVPAGRYMLDFFYYDIEVFFIQPYIAIKYPEVKGFSIL